MSERFDWTAVPDDQRAAFYAVLLAMTDADGTIEATERTLIDGLLALEGFSDATRTKLSASVMTPSVVNDGLALLSCATPECRFAVMVSLMDVALANGELDRREKRALVQARCRLGMRRDQMEAIEQFIREVKQIQQDGGGPGVVTHALKHATAQLKAAGIPLAAVTVSGMVIDLRTRWIRSGLTAVSASFEQLPNLHVVAGLSTWTAEGVQWVYDRGQQVYDTGRQWLDRATPMPLGPLAERRAQLVIQRLQALINGLTSQIEPLMAAANRAEADHQKLQELLARLRTLQQQIDARQRVTGGVS